MHSCYWNSVLQLQCRVSLAVWDHTVLPATRHKWTHPTLTTARQADTWFTYSRGMEGWVDLGDLLHTMYLTGVHQSDWSRPVGRPYTSWIATLKSDLSLHNLTFEDAIDKSLWRLLVASGATHWHGACWIMIMMMMMMMMMMYLYKINIGPCVVRVSFVVC